MKKQKVVVVTGANRGIGFELCKQLAEKGLIVVLTARDAKKGKAAADKLKGVVFHQLDVADEKSVNEFAAFMKKELGHVDILVNNAGISGSFNARITSVSEKEVNETLSINTFGALRVSQRLLPLMDSGRIINISSGMGQLTEMSGDYDPSYRMSKAALNAITKMLAAALPKMKVNSVCPGWVKTDMGGKGANLSVEESVEHIVWVALDEKVGSGKFYRFKKEIPW